MVNSSGTDCLTLYVHDDVVPIGDALGTCAKSQDLKASTKIEIIDGIPQVIIECTLAADDTDQTDFIISWEGTGGNWSLGSGSDGGGQGSGSDGGGQGSGSDGGGQGSGSDGGGQGSGSDGGGQGSGSDGGGQGSGSDGDCAYTSGEGNDRLNRSLPPEEVITQPISTEFCEDLVGELCITPVGSQESQTCLQVELIIQDELQRIAKAVVECSSDLLAIDGNGGSYQNRPY